MSQRSDNNQNKIKFVAKYNIKKEYTVIYNKCVLNDTLSFYRQIQVKYSSLKDSCYFINRHDSVAFKWVPRNMTIAAILERTFIDPNSVKMTFCHFNQILQCVYF